MGGRAGVVLGIVLGILVAASSCSTRSLEAASDAGSPGFPQGSRDGGGVAQGQADGGRDVLGPSNATGDNVGGGADGGGASTIVSTRLLSREVGPLAGTADTIAADDADVYWLTHDNELWMLDDTAGAAASAPRRLASDGGPSIVCDAHGRLAVAGDQLFWVAQWSGTDHGTHGDLHRTTKAGEDVVLVNDVAFSDPIDVVVDGDDIYWNEGISSGAPPASTFVRTLPRNASPGTNPGQPVTVDGFYQIASVAVIGPDLYWTTVFLGTTMFKPVLQRADLASLRQGMNPPPTPVATAWKVRYHRGNLFFGQITDLWHLAFTREPETLGPPASLAVLTNAAVGEIQFLDRWALASVWSGGCGSIRYQLLAIPIEAGAGPIVELAADLVTPAVLGSELAFVDAEGMLHLASLDDVRAALAAAQPPAM